MGNGLEKVPQTLPVLLHPGQLTTVGGNVSQCGRNKKEKKRLNIAAWKVRTLIDQDNTDRPYRRTVVIASELPWYKINIAALSKTRLTGKGELIEKSLGYSIFWSRRAPDDKREKVRYHHQRLYNRHDPHG